MTYIESSGDGIVLADSDTPSAIPGKIKATSDANDTNLANEGKSRYRRRRRRYGRV